MKKIYVMIGNYGSGKSELALNFAFKAAETGKTELIDLDLVNTYFRLTERGKLVEQKEIRLISPNYACSGVETLSLPAEVASAFAMNWDTVVFDVGGDAVGSTALGRYYEDFHGVVIPDAMCRLAVVLSERYITDRFLPDKAIDLVDEACAMIRTEIDSMPAELDDLRRKIMQQEIEEMALKKEDDQLSRDRLDELKRELADEKEQFNAMKSRWEAEKNGVESVKKLKSEIEQMHGEIERAQANLEYEKAAKLKYSDLPALEKQLKDAEAAAEKHTGDNSMVHDTVTENEIADIVGKWTGIPVSRLMEGEREKLLRLDEIIHKRVVGQDLSLIHI